MNFHLRSKTEMSLKKRTSVESEFQFTETVLKWYLLDFLKITIG